MLEDIISEYKHLCNTDKTNRDRLLCRNRIQCEIIKCSGLDKMLWIRKYAARFEFAVTHSDNLDELLIILEQ